MDILVGFAQGFVRLLARLPVDAVVIARRSVSGTTSNVDWCEGIIGFTFEMVSGGHYDQIR